MRPTVQSNEQNSSKRAFLSITIFEKCYKQECLQKGNVNLFENMRTGLLMGQTCQGWTPNHIDSKLSDGTGVLAPRSPSFL